MDSTVRNLDDEAYRALRARATKAIRAYLARRTTRRSSSLRLLRPDPYPAGNERLSSEIDEIVYANRR